ncbi:MAG TPA: BglG family transcription antiterminator [Chondromyces sp.]|nr:BglG family transcription antiterminator [Chondromyces sp.]
MLSDRYNKILEALTSNPSITSTELEKKYNLTRRQLGYSIDKINDWLTINKLPVIERTRKGHFVIAQSLIAKLVVNHEQVAATVNTAILTEEQRMQLIILMLLSSNEELSLNHFVIELSVSKNTILHDLKQAQTYLNTYELNIRYSRKNGYLLEGKEFQVRKLLMEITDLVLQMNNGESRLQTISGICSEQVNEFTRRIEKVEDKLNLKFTDEKMKAMPYILILINRRIQRGNIINSFPIKYDELSDTKEYKATEEILYDAKNIPVTERLFITLHLLTANVFSSEISISESVPNLVPAIDNMLRQFEKSACIYLQDRDQLLDKLLQHIKPAYYRIKYQLTHTVVFQGSLSQEFKELHHLVKRSIGPLKDLIGSDIPENEIVFITMLIGGWMKRQGESIEKKVKAIVVCPQGVSVSRLMFNELRELFPEFIFLDFLSVRQYLHYKLDYDVVFAPVFLETEKKLFVTKAFLGREDKYQLRKQVMLAVHGYMPNEINISDVLKIIKRHSTVNNENALIDEMEKYFNKDDYSTFVEQNAYYTDLNLDQLIIPENITLMDTVGSWEEALRISAEPLIRSGNIEPTYVEAMIRYCEKDPYIVIGPNIAIPHAAPEDGANKVGMSLLRVKEGVRYTNDYNINLIITISAVDKNQHIHALMQLMNLAGSENERNKLINAESVEEIYEIIQSYSKD